MKPIETIKLIYIQFINKNYFYKFNCSINIYVKFEEAINELYKIGLLTGNNKNVSMENKFK